MQLPFLGGKYVIEWSILRCYVTSLAGMYIKHLKKDRTRKNPTRRCRTPNWGLHPFFRNPNVAWKKQLQKTKKQPATVGIVLPSIHHVSTWEISTTIGPLKVWKIHKPNLSPFEGSSWWLGWWWWVLVRICQYYPWF